MILFLTRWLAHRRAIRRRWQADARLLVSSDPAGSYYEAQRRAFHSRSSGDIDEFWHWSKVASEIARIESRAEMNFAVLKALSDQEEAGRR
ncbi:hypothetical protein ASD54_23645 [Rhizobium sp. Root149]|uniref:hypothetical protein n=1 Tax=Rhizobium sp. Root149 TaxID=1736473 RepID=UPI000714F84B|nr:hypothetical protein [Rhizobium sp. Root149]KQZ59775.1 hypothetical protein ASD54_23645 [Rhizobium sp. Root149]